MKRWRLLPAILLIFTLTGCVQEYRVTEDKNDAIAEYMAGLILRADNDYKQDLIAQEDLDQVTVADEEKDVTGETSNEISPTFAIENDTTVNIDSNVETAQKEYTLTEVIGEKNFEIQYENYIIADTYPEDPESTYFSLTPRKGNQLLVVSFVVKNKTSKKKDLNLSKAKITYQLDVNVGTVYKPSLTLLENDLQYINIGLAKGESVPVLLIFEISKETDMANINLIVYKDDRSKIIEMK